MCSRSRTLPSLARFDVADLSLDESVPAAVRRAYRGATPLYTAQQVAYAVDRLAVRLTVDWQHANPVCAVVLPSGFVFAGMLLQRTVFPLQRLDVGAGANPLGLEAVAGRSVLLIDGGVDASLHDTLAQQLLAAGAGAVERVVLLAAVEPVEGYSYVGLHESSRELLGSGFELEGYGGNLPGIYTYPATT